MTSSSAKEASGASEEENVDSLVLDPSSRSRRNALTPESEHIDPIRQTEIQEKMSTMAVSSSTSSDSGGGHSSGACGSGAGPSG